MATYANYKPSNIPWVGDIPSHWNVVRLKYRCSLKGRIGWNGLKSEEFKEDAYAYLVTGQDFVGKDIDWSKCYQIDQWRYDEDPFIQLQDGDLLITKDGTIGKVAQVVNLDKPACLNSGIFVLKQLKGAFTQEYLYWTLVSTQLLDFTNYNSGGSTTIQHLYQNVFENMPLIIPPLEEQKVITQYLDQKCGSID
jgi:type I restriction enzyme S subunit